MIDVDSPRVIENRLRALEKRSAELEAENIKARRTGEYWKAELLEANKKLARKEALNQQENNDE